MRIFTSNFFCIFKVTYSIEINNFKFSKELFKNLEKKRDEQKDIGACGGWEFRLVAEVVEVVWIQPAPESAARFEQARR